MKRIFIILALATFFISVTSGVALASGYQTPAAGTAPHGGYLDSTSKCKYCHAVHEAISGGERLLRTTMAQSCDDCHITGTYGIKEVYNDSTTNYTNSTGKEHTLGGTSVTIPDSNKAALSTFNCLSCHTVHGANAIGAPSDYTNILRQDPYGEGGTISGTYTGRDTSQGNSFCADCHNKNLVYIRNGTSHVMTTALDSIAYSKSEFCGECHKGGVNPNKANSYPHMTTGLQFLKDNYDGTTTKLDSVCISCHQSGTTLGVGRTF